MMKEKIERAAKTTDLKLTSAARHEGTPTGRKTSMAA
jgi:hypothetical protein